MSYTSGQYKYLLVKRLQRHFSMKYAADRAYTQSFFWKLFDETVTVTEATYNNFVRLMDTEVKYMADRNVYRCEDIPTSDIQEHSLLLIDAFEQIGIGLVIDTSENSATFTKPNGDVMTYSIDVWGDKNYFFLNVKSRTEYQYARASAPYYNLQDMEVLDTAMVNPRVAGPGTYWSYDTDATTITITGDGAYAGATTEEQLGSGSYTTVIIGADVSRLLENSLEYSNIATIVLLHSQDAPLLLNSGVVGSKGTKLWTVYTDNEAFQNFAWPSSVSITWCTLDEWEG